MTEHLALAVALQLADDFRFLCNKFGASVHLNPVTCGFYRDNVLRQLQHDSNAVKMYRSLIKNYEQSISVMRKYS